MGLIRFMPVLVVAGDHFAVKTILTTEVTRYGGLHERWFCCYAI
jgi:hypothetical protein